MADAQLIVFEPSEPACRLIPTTSLGPWALGPLERLLRAADRGAPVILDLEQAPVVTPTEVAAVLWADDIAREHGIKLEIVTPDPISAELLDFAGIEAPVHAVDELPAASPLIKRASAY